MKWYPLWDLKSRMGLKGCDGGRWDLKEGVCGHASKDLYTMKKIQIMDFNFSCSIIFGINIWKY
jgi:hypothetical protein